MIDVHAGSHKESCAFVRDRGPCGTWIPRVLSLPQLKVGVTLRGRWSGPIALKARTPRTLASSEGGLPGSLLFLGSRMFARRPTTMREAAFTKRNQAKWKRLEALVVHADKSTTADESSTLYIQLTDDLSYARTFYPGAEVTAYLNALAARMHQHVHKNQKTRSDRLITFWTRELPLIMASTRKQLLISAAIFGTSVLIGALSAHYDTTFTRLILGDGYVDMTLENIKHGKPMDVYGGGESMDMFFQITFNNIKVALMAFAAGLLLGYGTWMVLISNGIMLGCFQYMFFQQHVLLQSVLGIWIHGTIEISSIVIAGSAGITMGNSILFPGTYTRLASFQRGALNGLKIVMGLVPCFIVAGFLESFVTRHSGTMPEWMSATIILTSLSFIILYFIIYPYHVEQRLPAHRAAQAA